MNSKRIFVAINLPTQIKKLIFGYYKQWLDLPIRWTPIENIHITVLFIGYVAEEAVDDVLRVCEEIVKEFKPFEINLSDIVYGPPSDKIPRMVWISGKAPQELVLLSQKLQEELLKLPSFKYWKPEERSFKLHITLGRIKTFELRQMEFIPEVNEKVDFKFKVDSFEIMESKLKKSGAEYNIIQKIEFRK